MKIKIKTEAQERKEQDMAWSRAIKDRDDWKCVICGERQAPNAHHILPRELKEFRYCLDNGLTLCVGHHKFNRLMSAHNAPLTFFMWLEWNRYELYKIARQRVVGYVA